MSAERVLAAIWRLQEETARTWVEPLVEELVEALAEDTTVVELRQELEFLKADQHDDDGLRGIIPGFFQEGLG